MPRGDGTGPEGLGPMTGRGLGYCTGYSTPGFTKGVGRGLGRGFSRGFRGGRGRGIGWGYARRPYYSTYPTYQTTVRAPPIYRPPIRDPYRYPSEIPVYQPNMAYSQTYTSPRTVTAPRYETSSQSQVNREFSSKAKEGELAYLQDYADSLKSELEEIEVRIDELSD